MPLSPGDRLGSHEIIGLLGAGGMGEVYRARDTKLNRQVAIKVLPDAHVRDPDRIARFQREAQAVAALNHPNIAGIFEFADSGDIKFLVLELIEGDTLAERLRRGPVPVEEALVIAKQILEALEAAHERGICHRDLKPANVKLAPSRGGSSDPPTVKVLDFGLAKFLQGGSVAPNLTQSPTLSLAGTYPGMILGTAGYMSPEQAKGVEADQRSDIFSLGCVLYELLTGRQAFEGETASEILASVLKTEVDLTALPARLNPRIAEVLRRCLEKNPKKRWHAAADVRMELESVITRALVDDDPRARHAGRPFWRGALPVAAGLLLVAIGAAYGAWTMKPGTAQAVIRLSVPLPDGQRFTSRDQKLLAPSPDGGTLAYVVNRRLYVRSISSFESHVVSGTDGWGNVTNPVFSPDGQSLAFFSAGDRTIKRISTTGGIALTVGAAESVHGMSWSDDSIIFGEDGKGILRVSAKGGTPEVISAVEAGQSVTSPQMLPGGAALLFTLKNSTDGRDKGQVVLQPMDGSRRRVLLDAGADAAYLATGHLAYARSGILLAVPFDLQHLTIAGSPVPVIEGVRRSFAGAGVAQAAYSQAGTLVYAPGPVTAEDTEGTDLAIFDRSGGVQPLKLPPARYRSPRVSPDGRFVAFDTEEEGDAIVWVYELAGTSAIRRLTFVGKNRAPIWSADSKWVAFQSERDGDRAVWRPTGRRLRAD